MPTDTRPKMCRNRLLDEGNLYPKSGCAVEGCKGAFGAICTEKYSIEPLDKKPQGGQHVGVTNTGVRVTHLASGLTASVTARSQHLSRKIAMEMIEYGLTYERDLV